MTEKKLKKLKEWACRIYEVSHCEMTIQKWCEENGFSKDTYYYWKGEVEKYKPALESSSNPLDFFNINQNDTISNDPVFAEIPLPFRPDPVSGSSQEDHFLLDKCFSESKIVIQHNHFHVFVGEGFNKNTLQSVLEVVGRA